MALPEMPNKRFTARRGEGRDDGRGGEGEDSGEVHVDGRKRSVGRCEVEVVS